MFFVFVIAVGIVLALFLMLPKQETINIEPEITEIVVKPIEIPLILQRIAIAESGGKQFNSDGTVIMGIINPHDIGKYQINELYWRKKAKELGYDIYTLEGNTSMALWIYQNYGTAPWNWSKSKWSNQ